MNNNRNEQMLQLQLYLVRGLLVLSSWLALTGSDKTRLLLSALSCVVCVVTARLIKAELRVVERAYLKVRPATVRPRPHLV